MGSTTKFILNDSSLLRDAAYINGEWIKASTGQTFTVIDPSDGEIIATLPDLSVEDAKRAIEHAGSAFKTFKKTTARERARLLRRWGELMLANIDDLSAIMTWENGKCIADARGEITFAATFFEWYSGEAERAYGETIPSANPNVRILTIKQPIGVVAAMVPWNFPAAMVSRKVGAAIAAGCTVLVKPAAETPLTSLALSVLAERAGIPPGVFNVVLCGNDNLPRIGKLLCESSGVKKVSFTGSTRVGKILMSQSASSLKKLSLELGGNSPFIIFDDADVAKAVEALIVAKVRNSGQTCVCANRIYVQEGVYNQVATLLVKEMQKLKVGAGFESDVSIGPLMHDGSVKKATGHIEDALSKGAELLLGGNASGGASGKGFFFEPTVLGGMNSDMLTNSEEVFAPVASLFKFKTEEEVLALANEAEVGLGSYVCTSDIARMWRVAEELEVGLVAVNGGLLAAVESPFGGVKWSGFGKEGGKYGIEDYLVVKSIMIAVPQSAS